MAQSRAALKRLVRDLKELTKEPLDGACLAPADEENLFELHGNIVIPEGPWEGLLVHFILYMKSTYPITSPAGSVAPKFPFTGRHHEHIYSGRMCTDMLSDFENYFEVIDGGERKAASGWSAGVTLSSLLMVLKHFFVETDFPPPHPDEVDRVFHEAKYYKCPGCSHTTESPFPELPKTKGEGGGLEEEKEEEGPASEEKEKAKRKKVVEERARSLLVCSASKENYVDCSTEGESFVLGYPILMRYDSRKRLQTTLIPEPLSYEQYIFQIQEKGIAKLDNFQGVKLRTPCGHPYTNWLPVYINESHFSENRQCIENTISVLSNGIEGKSQNDFEPWMVVRVLPSLMNKMVVAMMDGDLHESESAIYAYCHYLRLLRRFLDDGEGKLRKEMDQRIGRFISHSQWRSKKHVPDLGEMLVLLAVSDKFSFFDPSVQKPLMQEAFARKVFWVEKSIRESGNKLEVDQIQARALKQFEEGELEKRANSTLERLDSDFDFNIQGYHFELQKYNAIGNSRRRKSFATWESKIGKKTQSGISFRLSVMNGVSGMSYIRMEADGPAKWGPRWEVSCLVRVMSRVTEEVVFEQDCVFNGSSGRGGEEFPEFHPPDFKKYLDEKGDLPLNFQLTFWTVGSPSHQLAHKRDAKEVKSLVEEKRVEMEQRRDLVQEKKNRQADTLLFHLQIHFEAAAVANKLMVFNLMASSWFACGGAMEVLDASYGLPPQGVVSGFQQAIKNVQQMSGYESFLKVTKFDRFVQNATHFAQFIRASEDCAQAQGYDRSLRIPFAWRGLEWQQNSKPKSRRGR